MGIEVALGTAALGLGIFGTVEQSKAQKKQARISRAAAEESRRGEQLRQRQAQLELARKRREARREAIRERSRVIAGSVGRGLGVTPGQVSSITSGALGQGVTELGTQIADINQNEELGNAIFGVNENLAQLREQSSVAQAQGTRGQAISSIGGQIVQNFPAISRVGNTLFPQGRLRTKNA